MLHPEEGQEPTQQQTQPTNDARPGIEPLLRHPCSLRVNK